MNGTEKININLYRARPNSFAGPLLCRSLTVMGESTHKPHKACNIYGRELEEHNGLIDMGRVVSCRRDSHMTAKALFY